MKDKICDGCGHVAEEGEMFSIFVDPNTEWWRTLFDQPAYCKRCVKVKSLTSQGKGE